MKQLSIPPRFLCNAHLLGEHFELHLFKGSLDKGRSVEGYIAAGILNPARLQHRHDELVQEMRRRGIKHNSPLQHAGGENLPLAPLNVQIDNQRGRCRDCAAKMVQRSRCGDRVEHAG